MRAFELWGIIAFNYGVGLQRELYYVHRLSLVCASAQFGLYHMMCVRAERGAAKVCFCAAARFVQYFRCVCFCVRCANRC